MTETTCSVGEVKLIVVWVGEDADRVDTCGVRERGRGMKGCGRSGA